MANEKDTTQFFDEALTSAVDKGVYHLVMDDAPYTLRTVMVGGRELLFFGSCGYLGLDGDPRIREGAIRAIEQYGLQVPIARTFLCVPQFDELEETLGRIFEAHVVVTPSTTMANYTALPTLVEPNDAVVLDKTVHLSVQMAARLLQASGIKVETIPHARLDVLEDRIRELRSQHRSVWYLRDGIHSMNGEAAPVAAIVRLLEEHEQLRVYLDDAHGMSSFGRHGRGYVLADHPLHERMVMATSLNKAFGGQGGALVLPTAEMKRRIRVCGAASLFGFPLSTAGLGASLASARIHLSSEITQLQNKLRERMELCHRLIERHGLTLSGSLISPIKFIRVGSSDVATRLTQKLLAAGIYVNMTAYPVVSRADAGIRFTVTAANEPEDIDRLIATLAELLSELSLPSSR